MDGEDRDRLAARILDAMPAFIAYFDPDLCFVECNVASAGIFGLTREQLLGRRLGEVLSGPGSRMERALQQAARSKQSVSTAFTFARPGADDVVHAFAASIVPELDVEGRLLGICASAFDVTDQTLELKAAARFGDSLNIVMQTIVSTLDADVMLERVVEESLRATGADYSLVVTRLGDKWVVAHDFGQGGSERVGVDYALEERPVILDAVTTGEVQFVEDAMAHPRTNKQIMTRFGIKSFVAVPLTLKGETLGVFEISWIRDKVTFDATVAAYLRNLASAVSLALGRMREYEHQRRIATTLQESLLHLPDRVDGVRFESLYAAASDEALVGGDFYDVFEVGEGLVGITVGDVSGKGLHAAVMTSTVRDSLRLCALDGLTPSEAVAKTNEVLVRVSAPEMFATLFYALLDVGSGVLTYVTAAHPSGVIARSGGGADLLEGRNPMVGAFPGVAYAQRSVVLGPGDTLLVYTDGLTEARKEGEMFGEHRLLKHVAGLPADRHAGLLAGALDTVRAYCGGELCDDVAMLAVGIVRS